ncbi:hypothetical protein [Clostridium sp. Marseille-Q2269]|uniref:hypothetical protein n=1 Tax=Clostridium sp. Marseille-Q2269 TaxID=2942205 RepID=UPI002073776D|nr:hypothetical protein [Clostridium sp. Marseille-Q2269]
MKQINSSIIKSCQDRDPSWCVLCDKHDRCSSCDAVDFGEADCGNCDYGREE